MPNDIETTLSGRFDEHDDHYHHVPFEVPPGVDQLSFRFTYQPRDVGRVGFGVFAPEPGVPRTGLFRGWSDHWRTEIEIGETHATPGYLPGPTPPGRWNLLLAPFGLPASGVAWSVQIRFGRVKSDSPCHRRNPAPLDLGGVPGWYRGDLHVHSLYSADAGAGKENFHPREIVALAKDAGLDFFASTDHNTSAAHGIWGEYRLKDLLIINGQEVTMRGGHLGAVGIDAGQWIDFRAEEPGEVRNIVTQVHEQDGLAIINHPIGRDCPDCDWEYGFEVGQDAVEVWNGRWRPGGELALRLWDRELRKGRKIVAVGGSDAHRVPDVIGRPQTVVYARRLSKAAVVAGIRMGRVYVTRDSSLSVEVLVSSAGSNGSAGVGDTLRHDPEAVIRLRGRLSGVDDGYIVVSSREGILVVLSVQPDTLCDGWEVDLTGAASFIRIEVRDLKGDMLLFTNPVWLESVGEDDESSVLIPEPASCR